MWIVHISLKHDRKQVMTGSQNIQIQSRDYCLYMYTSKAEKRSFRGWWLKVVERGRGRKQKENLERKEKRLKEVERERGRKEKWLKVVESGRGRKENEASV
ncbi:hypothetical protein E2542_SST16543 [Spatholobus suberectus]|nr:hypothetical protein E2542_SST16543 [Spatholobus suberectus]